MVARAGLRDDVDAPHGAAAMRADRDLAFDEGIAAGFLISRSVADVKELTACFGNFRTAISLIRGQRFQ